MQLFIEKTHTRIFKHMHKIIFPNEWSVCFGKHFMQINLGGALAWLSTADIQQWDDQTDFNAEIYMLENDQEIECVLHVWT